MRSKKFVLSLVFVLIFAAAASAASTAVNIIKLGMLSKLNIEESGYNKFMAAGITSGKFDTFSRSANHMHNGDNTIVSFHDSLNALLLALDSNKVDEIALPGVIARYILQHNEGKYRTACIVRPIRSGLAIGFKDTALRDRVNEALAGIESDGTLADIVDKYVFDILFKHRDDEPGAVKFEQFEGAETIKVADTGALPPVDYIAADGTPDGFNIAILAELAKRLKVNIELVNVDASARASALSSGRVDAVFWFQVLRDLPAAEQIDVPESVALSEPYFIFYEYMHLSKK
nr:transporter substrate-binding domain-containing protein [Synergistaceae bacterium]